MFQVNDVEYLPDCVDSHPGLLGFGENKLGFLLMLIDII